MSPNAARKNHRNTVPTPLQRLLDLDAGRLPRLAVRLDGKEIPLRLPESLALADALRLGDLLRTLADPHTTPPRFDAAALAVVQVIVPDLADTLGPGRARRLVAFYAEHLARAAEALGGAEGPAPFLTPAAPDAPVPASPRSMESLCAPSC